MPPTPTTIHSYTLFGESTQLPDVLHCETIAARSVLHDWELAPHRHARLHQVLLLASGGGMASLDGAEWSLPPGTLVNVPPGVVHAFRFEPGTQGWVATMADVLLDELFIRAGDLRGDIGQACVLQAEPGMPSLMQQIWDEFSGEQRGRALILRGLGTTLLGRLARSMVADRSKPDDLQDSNLVQRFRALIDQHFQEQWGVADYARALAISPTHLSRLARAATGQSALRLIDARTLREARRHLAYTNLSISTIAYALGFSDPAYFSRVFTQDAGLSPRAFRAQLAKSR